MDRPLWCAGCPDQPFLSRLAGNMNRKHLLSGMTVLMALSGIIIAFAPNASMYMAGRALIGIAIGGFWSMSAATAIRLVPQHQVSRALAILTAATRWRRWSPPRWAVISARPLAGAARFFARFPWRLWRSSGNILACPTWTGTSGRRHVKRISPAPPACGFGGSDGVRPVLHGTVCVIYLCAPFLETVTHVSPSGLSLILLTIGIAGFIGTLIVALVLNAAFYLTLMAIPLLMALIAGY